MIGPSIPRTSALAAAIALVFGSMAAAQSGPETYSGTASVKTAGGASATAPVTVTITGWTSDAERDKLIATLKSAGGAGLHKQVAGMKSLATVTLGQQKFDAQYAYALPSSEGRIITVVTDEPMFYLGAGAAGAKAKAGHDFGVVTLEVDGSGTGKGTITPAASLKMSEGGALIVEDYSHELVTVTAVKKK